MKENKFWSEGTKITSIVVASVIIVALIIVSAISNSSSNETITVEGASEVSVTPDLVKIYLEVDSLKPTAVEAKDANAEIVTNIKSALTEAGFQDNEIETQGFNVYEEFDWTRDKRVSLGYKATHNLVVSIAVDDESRIGNAIDIAIDNGALLNYINFELSQDRENEYKAIAMKSAAEDAKIKAEAVADGLGEKLGKVVSTSSNDFSYRPWLAYAESSGDALLKGTEIATNIDVGDQKVTSRITVTYKLK